MAIESSHLVVLDDRLDDDMKLAVLEYIDVLDLQIIGNEDLLDALMGRGEYAKETFKDSLKGIFTDEELEAEPDPESILQVKHTVSVLEDIRFRLCRQFSVEKVMLQ